MPKNYWNYRVIKSTFDTSEGEEASYAIHEVHYENDSIVLWSEKPTEVVGESIASLHNVLDKMRAAINKPYLIEVDGKLYEDTSS